MTGSTVDPLSAILATNHIACMSMLNNTENSYSPGKQKLTLIRVNWILNEA